MTNSLPEKQSGRKAAKYRGAQCLNCRHPLDLSDVYCSYCGQLNTTKSLSLKDFFGEFIGSIITYDSKFRSTLKDLLFKPGIITRNYVKGQRLSYANPFRFFLSVSIIYFLVNSLITSFTGKSNLFNVNSNDDMEQVEFGPTGDNFKIFSTPTDSSTTQKQSLLNQNAAKYNYPSQTELDSIIKASKQQKENVNKKPHTYTYISQSSLDTISWANRTAKKVELYYDFYKVTEIENPTQALDSLQHKNSRFNKWLYEKNSVYEQVAENPSEFITYLVEKTPFFVFFFTPFYAVFFWLIYSKKKHTYMEHMIFIFHIFSFVFLGMLICLVPDILLDTKVFSGLLFIIIGPFYFYKALRNFYQQRRLITIIKFIFLNFIFMFSASISALLFFAVSAALY